MKKQSLLTELVVLFLLSATIPTILIGVMAYSSTYNTIWNNTVHSTEQMVDQVKKSIGNLFQDAEYFLKIGEEQSVVAYLASNENDYENAKKILEVFEIYSGNCGFDKNVNNIYAVSLDGKMISARYGVSKIDKENFSLFDWDQLMRYSGETLVASGNINPSPYYEDSQFLYIGMPLIVKPLRDPFGAVIIELKDTIIADFCNSADIAGKGYFTVFTGDSQVIFERDEDTGNIAEDLSGKDEEEAAERVVFDTISQETAGSFVTKKNGEKTLVLFDTIQHTDWKLVGQIAEKDLMEDMNGIKRSITIILLTVILFGFLMYLLLTRQLIMPLKKLQAVMRMVALGEKDVRFEGRVNNEIGVVGESFNLMIDKLDNMNQQDRKNQASLQKASLDLMQAQINPHFLYNTLETIIWSANAGNNQQVIEVVDALASFYRLTLSEGESWITVAEEIRMIKNYLIIQKTKYKDAIQEHIEVEDAIRTMSMLKLTLQPIVENAVYHGLSGKSEGGELWIRGKREDQYLVFEISDNGVGMAEDKLHALQSLLTDNQVNVHAHENGGFGLENVNARIKLYYGEDCGVTIDNMPGSGTIVTVRLRII